MSASNKRKKPSQPRKLLSIRRKKSSLVFFLIATTVFAQGFAGLKKLPAPINTADGDLAPSLSADGKTLIFQSNRSGTVGWYDLFESTWDEDTKNWSEPENIKAVNTKYFDGLPSLSADANTLYFSTNRDTKNVKSQNLDIWISERSSAGVWQEPEAMDVLNSKKYDAKPSLSFDGKRLYFVSARAGGKGGLDIWVTDKDDTGEWADPEPLPFPINTKNAEFDPYLLHAGDQFYFASDRPGGSGQFDLYRMKRRNINSKWTRPKNLGKKVNSDKNEYFFTLPAVGDFIYISQGESHKEDIYKLILPEDLRPTPVVIVRGLVTDKSSGNPLGNVPVKFRGTNKRSDIIEVEFTSHKETGKLFGVMTAGYNYEITVNYSDYLPFKIDLDLQKLSRTYEKEVKIPLSKPKEVVATYAGVYFKAYGCKLNDESKVSLRLYADYMQANPDMRIKVIGSSDIEEGRAGKHMKLSETRAQVVRQFLEELGVAANRMETGQHIVGGRKKDRRKPSRLHPHRTVNLEIIE